MLNIIFRNSKIGTEDMFVHFKSGQPCMHVNTNVIEITAQNSCRLKTIQSLR